MELINAKDLCREINIPNELKNKLDIFTNCILSEHEIALFETVLGAISEYILKHNITLDKRNSFNVFFTDDGVIHLVPHDKNMVAGYIQLAFYNMEKLREDEEIMIFAFIEELSHHFFRISDEVEIKYIVDEIIKTFKPDFNLQKFIERVHPNGFYNK